MAIGLFAYFNKRFARKDENITRQSATLLVEDAARVGVMRNCDSRRQNYSRGMGICQTKHLGLRVFYSQ